MVVALTARLREARGEVAELKAQLAAAHGELLALRRQLPQAASKHPTRSRDRMTDQTATQRDPAAPLRR